jgi:hypothetical protein
MAGGGGSDRDGRAPTAPPPFDPEEYARDSEMLLRAAKPAQGDLLSTAQLPAAPPLNKRVRMTVPPADLEWFDLSETARALVGRIDGTRTLFEIIEGAGIADAVAAIAQLHDNGLLAYED